MGSPLDPTCERWAPTGVVVLVFSELRCWFFSFLPGFCLIYHWQETIGGLVNAIKEIYDCTVDIYFVYRVGYRLVVLLISSRVVR